MPALTSAFDLCWGDLEQIPLQTVRMLHPCASYRHNAITHSTCSGRVPEPALPFLYRVRVGILMDSTLLAIVASIAVVSYAIWAIHPPLPGLREMSALPHPPQSDGRHLRRVWVPSARVHCHGKGPYRQAADRIVIAHQRKDLSPHPPETASLRRRPRIGVDSGPIRPRKRGTQENAPCRQCRTRAAARSKPASAR